MKRKIGVLLILLLVFGSSIGVKPSVQAAESWQASYTEILTDLMLGPLPSPWYEQSQYSPMYWAFFLHDIDGDGTPELIITIGTHYRSLASSYTFRNSSAIPLTLPAGVFGDGFSLPLDNSPGIVAFGGDAIGSFRSARLVVEQNGLVADVTLSLEIGFCSDTDTETHSYFLNEIEVSDAEFYIVFDSIVGAWDERTAIPQHEITEANIQSVISGWRPAQAVSAGAINVTIDGSPVIFEDQHPVIIDGRTLVPVRGVFEMLGFEVSWNGDTRTASLSRADYVVNVTIDSYEFTANSMPLRLDVPAQIIGGRTMLPIRAVLESVGYSLEWDGAISTVVITTK